MTTKAVSALKELWITGYKPVQQDYHDHFESYYNKIDNAILSIVTSAGSGDKVLANNGTYVGTSDHTHAISAVTGLQGTLDSKVPNTTFATTATSLQNQINQKQPLGDYATNTTTDALSAAIDTKQPSGDYATNSYVVSADNYIIGLIDTVSGNFRDDRIAKTIIQPHTFVVGDIVKFDGGLYTSAWAETLNDSMSLGMVTSVSASNIFGITMLGYVDVLSGLVPETIYYLSTQFASAGKMTSIAPTAVGDYLKPVFYSISSSSGYFLNYDSELIEESYVPYSVYTPEISAIYDSITAIINDPNEPVAPFGYTALPNFYPSINEAVSGGSYKIFLTINDVYSLTGDIVFNSDISSSEITPAGSGAIVLDNVDPDAEIHILGEHIDNSILYNDSNYRIYFEDAGRTSNNFDIQYAINIGSNEVTATVGASGDLSYLAANPSKWHFFPTDTSKGYRIISVDVSAGTFLLDDYNNEQNYSGLTLCVYKAFTNVFVGNMTISSSATTASIIDTSYNKLVGFEVKDVKNNSTTPIVNEPNGYRWIFENYNEYSDVSSPIRFAPYSLVNDSILKYISPISYNTFNDTYITNYESSYIESFNASAASGIVNYINCDFEIIDVVNNIIPTYDAVHKFTHCSDINGYFTDGGGALSIIVDDSTSGVNFYPAMTSGTSGTMSESTISSNFYFDPSTGTLNATDFNSLSDQNLKENIVTIEGATDIIRRLNGVGFDWKSNGKSSFGVIAQELEKVIPELVTTGLTNKSVNYDGLIGFLINTIKEMDARITELENR